jgi:hypothetical protein
MSAAGDDAVAINWSFSDLFPDTSLFPDTGYGFFQVCFLLAIYLAFIFYGSLLLAQGSELLIFVPSVAPIVGTILIPILGQLPDALIVIFR